MTKDVERFRNKVVINEATGCHEWTAAKFRFGYGVFRVDYKNKYAHRWWYEQIKGRIPPGVFVCHKCDNPACVNVEHLFLGTARDNNADRDAKGRMNYTGPKNPPRGEAHWKARLSREQVLEIRRVGRLKKQKELARDYGVSTQTISAVLRREVWKGAEP